ncbi:retrovirus-related pol polyprotein from transposon TNT 1-94 [Tanacetum coccineum]
MSFLIMLDEITLESLTEEQFDCISIEYSRENYPEDYKSDLENLKDIYKTMNGGVEYPRTQNASPSEIKEPYEPSPRMYSYEQPSCLGSTFVGETFRKSDQMHQTIEKSLLAMTHKLDDMIELPKSQPKRIYNKDLECEIVMVKIPKCMAWLDDKPIGELDTMEDKKDRRFTSTKTGKTDISPARSLCLGVLCIRGMVHEEYDLTVRGNWKRHIIPEILVHSSENPLRELGGNPPSQPSVLSFFAGRMHENLRPILLKHWENKDPDMKIFGKLQKNSTGYTEYMTSSKYRICAKGYEVNSPRVVEAIFHECVPVIISDNHVPAPPF